MTAYVVIQVKVTDEEKYEAYKRRTPASLEKYGGRFLVRGGAQEDLEGSLEYSRIVLLEFPDVDRAKQWYNSPEYQGAKTLRAGASVGVFTVVEGAEG